MQARLKVLHDKANVKQVRLLPVTLIGRSAECNLKIASSQVSRAHCRITLGEDTVYVEDLGSANGTLIDGIPLVAHQPTSVVPGAKLVVGPAEFLIDYVASTSVTMVLPHSAGPIDPTLSSTELLLPTKDVSVRTGDSSRAVLESPIAEAPPLAVAVASKARPVAVTSSAAPVVAAPVAATPVVTAVAQAVPVAIPVAKPVAAVAVKMPEVEKAAPVALPPIAVTESAPVELAFSGFVPTDDGPVVDDSSQFLFGDMASSEDSPESVSAPQRRPADGKKGGMKSLFSLFGRKAKATAESSSSASDAGSNPLSVFLPTKDQVETNDWLADTDAEPAHFNFEDPAAAEATAQAVPFEQPQAMASPAPAEEDDDFQQFLKQL